VLQDAVSELVGMPTLKVLSRVLDIEERKLTEKEQCDLGARLITAQEEERARISRELHDDIGQRVALLIFELHELSLRAGELDLGTGEQLQHLYESAKEIASAVHELSHKLHPAILLKVGLRAAIQNLCRHVEQCGVAVQFTAKDIPTKLGDDVSLCIFRVTQEALNNVLKHSGAHQVSVELVGQSRSVRVRIVDSGQGFDPKRGDSHAGLGLLSMRERVHLMGENSRLRLDQRGAPRLRSKFPWFR